VSDLQRRDVRGKRLPPAARAVLVVTVLAGAGCEFFVTRDYVRLGIGSLPMIGALAALVTASWIWPIVMYSDQSSQAHHLDEGFFVVLALVVPPLGTVTTFLVATLAAQLLHRRPFAKTVFNVGQVLVATTAGVAIVEVLAPPHGRLGAEQLGAAVLGAIAFFVVNTVALTSILVTTRTERFRTALTDGVRIRALLFGASVALGLVAALAASAYPYAGVVVVLPFLAFRQAIAGHFQARHDRARLLGLFDATAKVQAAMGSGDVTSALIDAASRLLRGPEVALVPEPPTDGVMAARVSVDGAESWLTVRGRSPSEPLDSADATLLEALAAIGSGALATSALYEERRRDHERLVAITASLAEGVCAFDEEARVTFMNPAAEQMLGSKMHDLAARGLEPFEMSPLTRAALRSIRQNEVVRGEQATFYRRGGMNFPVEVTCGPILSGERVVGAVLTFRDISQRVVLEYHAFHDLLTGLPNRRIFLDRLQHALRRADRTGETHAVLFVDVDRFKPTNDSLGHQTGDELLAGIAERLRRATREGDTLARFGGDEFTLLLENIGDPATAEATAARVLEAVQGPMNLSGGRTIEASVSVGVALAVAGSSADDVLHEADVAMYQAKRRGGGAYERFDSTAMVKRSVARLDLESGLRRAVERHELVVHYQPLVSTRTGAVHGAEALVRWDHPEHGILPPADFIGLAEETDLIMGIGEQVLDEACRQAKEWVRIAGDPFTVSVNLSARQFQQGEQARAIKAALDATGLDASNLCVEITETVAMSDVDYALRIMAELKALGVHLAIDDFGTGHSSLNYLKTFPVDFVKIDKGFVQDLETNTVDNAIVAAVIDLARAIGITTVAEGVETAGQLAQLTGLGCPLAQGYYLAHPLTAADLTEVLLRQRDAEGSKIVPLRGTLASAS
jgi:diguanylate cyclase (GGDEF)-like protein/PAS domain S-box-containing protein